MTHFSRLDIYPKTDSKSWGIHFDYFYIIVILGALLGPFSEKISGDSFREYLLWSISKGFSIAAIFLFWRTVSRALEVRNRSAISLKEIFTIGAFGGVIHALVLKMMIWLFSLDDNSTLLIRLFSAGLFAAIWLPAQSATVANFSKFSSTRISLREQMFELQEVDLARKRLKLLNENIMQKRIEDLVSESKEDAFRTLEEAISNMPSGELPAVTRALASEHLRSLAHRISELDGQQITKGRLRGIQGIFSTAAFQAINQSIRRRPLNPEWFLMVALAIFFATNQSVEWPINLYLASIIAICTFMVHKSGSIVFKRFPDSAFFMSFIVTILSIATPISFFHFIPGYSPTLRNQAIFALIILLITIMGHLAQGTLIRQTELLVSEESALEKAKSASAEINFELVRTTRKWAKHIHGNIQSKLHAYALVLEQAQLREDSEGVERAIEEIRRTIMELDKEISHNLGQSLFESVKEVCDLWDGIVKIELILEKEIQDTQFPRIADLCDCLTEAITNSVRHGSANLIRISLEIKLDRLLLTVSDNGVGFTEVYPGLGTGIFDLASNRKWSLVRDAFNDKTVLSIEFDRTEVGMEG